MIALARDVAGLRAPLERMAAALAILGGTVLMAAMIFTVMAVILAAAGRPVLGDTEIVELAAGVAIASFMPWCQLTHGHIVIDVFTNPLPAAARRALDTIAAAITALVVLVLTWRLILGGFDSFARGRISMFLELPQWWGYAAAGLACAFWTVTAFFILAERACHSRKPDA